MLPSDLPAPPRRRPDASKHDHGRVVVVGGAVGMAGAPALAAMAALRAGAGLVELVTPDAITAVAASFDPCVMTSGLPTSAAGTFAAQAAAALDGRARRATALAVGPGMGRSDDVVELVGRLWHEAASAAVFDADALWALSRLPRGTLRRHAGPRVVTPHAGEMARLVGHEGPARLGRGPLEAAAGDLARDADVVVVLKGAGTLVVAPGREARNETGNPGLATAGTGDVLTGIVTALLAQGLEPFAAARLGVWLHGRSGDVAAATLGEWSLTARDVIERLHLAFLEAAGGSRCVAR
jgi:hydroxyethylthiazole kinase-like uncharacterized protein yjeF